MYWFWVLCGAMKDKGNKGSKGPSRNQKESRSKIIDGQKYTFAFRKRGERKGWKIYTKSRPDS